MKRNCEDYTEEEKSVSMRFAPAGGPNISKEARMWLDQAQTELRIQERQIQMLLTLFDDAQDKYPFMDRVREKLFAKYDDNYREIMYYFPDDLMIEWREQCGMV